MKAYFDSNSGNQLIHITNSFSNINSILESKGLRLKYCKEEFCINYGKEISKSVHPMVCFSELNSSLLPNMQLTYGKYGIAFSENWVIKNNIQPVMYIEQNSPVAESIATLLKFRRKLPKGHELRLPIITIKCFIKNTIGYNSYLDKNNFVFKQENEWRFVPQRSTIKTFISESRSTYLRNEEKYNSRLLRFPLIFDLESDINCIYCETKAEVNTIKQKYQLSDDKVKLTPWK